MHDSLECGFLKGRNSISVIFISGTPGEVFLVVCFLLCSVYGKEANSKYVDRSAVRPVSYLTMSVRQSHERAGKSYGTQLSARMARLWAKAE